MFLPDEATAALYQTRKQTTSTGLLWHSRITSGRVQGVIKRLVLMSRSSTPCKTSPCRQVNPTESCQSRRYQSCRLTFSQPCDLNGFMDYLYYVERRAEDLQFVLWYCDYVRRWSRLLSHQRQLSPVWDPVEAAAAAQAEPEAMATATATFSETATTPTKIAIQPPRPTACRKHALHSREPSTADSQSGLLYAAAEHNELS